MISTTSSTVHDWSDHVFVTRANPHITSQYKGAWLVKWRLSVPSVRKVVGSTPPLVAT